MFDLQKANLTKRISAFIFDLIVLSVISVGFGTIISYITDYDSHYNTCLNIISEYEEKYNASYYMDEDEYYGLSDPEKESYASMEKALSEDSDFIYHSNVYFSLSILIISIGIFFGMLVSEFIIPLIFGNGMTLGKKIFGLAVMRQDHIQVSPLHMFIRTFLGKYTVETMIPVLLAMMIFFGSIGIMGTIIIFGMGILQIVCMILSHTNACIHDIFAGTVVIDFASQKIFKNPEEMKEELRNASV